MTLFNQVRLTNEVFKLDIDRMRRGWYSDKYFANILAMLEGVSQTPGFHGTHAREVGQDTSQLNVGDIEVEVQFFTRRAGNTVVVGVDKALSMLRHCTGLFDDNGDWVSTWEKLSVTAVYDGDVTTYDGEPLRVQPVIRVNGRYRDFALLETPMLGILSRSSRIATNVYNVLRAAKGKPVLFFPARFDLHEVQAADGYAYDIAIERFNMDFGSQVRSFVSTDAQGDWWGGAAGGTIAHAAIACFLGDTAVTMLAFAEHVNASIPRIALVDFNNDSIRDSLRVMQAMFERYAPLMEARKEEEAQKYILFGVRLDTSGSLRDVSIPPLGDPKLDLGVTPRLVFHVRQAIDKAWKKWDLPDKRRKLARTYCRNVQIVVTGGFGPQKITKFEKLHVPVDIYGVGSSLLSNDKETNNDFTADIVRVKINGSWCDLAKVGRAAAPNPALAPVDLTTL